MKFKVEQHHLKKGQRGSSFVDPVALAIKEKCPDLYVEVNESRIWIGDKKFVTPINVFGFILRFDRGEDERPFSFELDV